MKTFEQSTPETLVVESDKPSNEPSGNKKTKRLKIMKAVKAIGILFVGFVGVLLIANAIWNYQSLKPLKQEIQAIRNAGEPLFLEEFPIRSVPNEENAAVGIALALDLEFKNVDSAEFLKTVSNKVAFSDDSAASDPNPTDAQNPSANSSSDENIRRNETTKITSLSENFDLSGVYEYFAQTPESKRTPSIQSYLNELNAREKFAQLEFRDALSRIREYLQFRQENEPFYYSNEKSDRENANSRQKTESSQDVDSPNEAISQKNDRFPKIGSVREQTRLSPESKQILGKFLNAAQDRLALLDWASRRLEYSGTNDWFQHLIVDEQKNVQPIADFLDIFRNEMESPREIGRFLRLKILWECDRCDFDEAIRWTSCYFRLNRLQQESAWSCLTLRLGAISYFQPFVETAAEILQTQTISDDVLNELQEAVENYNCEKYDVAAILGERSLGFSLLDRQLFFTNFWLGRGYCNKSKTEYLQFMRRWIENPIAEYFSDWEENRGKLHPLVALLVPAGKLAQTAMRRETFFRNAIVVLIALKKRESNFSISGDESRNVATDSLTNIPERYKIDPFSLIDSQNYKTIQINRTDDRWNIVSVDPDFFL